MLASVLGNYIDSLTEREFDEPFIALLHLQGFFDIHYLHGSFEFGKDFIAKNLDDKQVKQYVFQSKAGDLGLSDWSAVRGQLDMLRTDVKSHPNFDASLTREAILVTTGRLVGAAPLAAQGYRDHLAQLNESSFVVWDRDILVEQLINAPSALSTSSHLLLQALGTTGIDLNFQFLENYSRSWIRLSSGATLLKDVIEASIVANHCKAQGRLDLAAYVPLMLLRAVVTTAHGETPFSMSAAISYTASIGLFRNYGIALWYACKGSFLDSDGLFKDSTNTFMSYPVKCSIIMELLGLLSLLFQTENNNSGEEIATYLSAFVAANDGCSHPASDRWAYSLIPICLSLSTIGYRDSVKALLTRITIWVCDHYDEGNIGLAGPYSSISKEAAHFFGIALEHIDIPRRSASFLATFILDLCTILEMPQEYDLFRNDFLAVEIHLPVIESPNERCQYCTHLEGYIHEPNAPFAENWRLIAGGFSAPHHERPNTPYFSESLQKGWCLLAIGSVTRDRHLVRNSRALLENLGKTG